MKRVAPGMLAATVTIALVAGCANRQNTCMVVGGVLGAAAGGVTAGMLRYHTADHIPSDETMAVVTGAGAVGGGLLGTILGYNLCKPGPEPVTQAPPVETPPPAGTQIAHLEGTNFAFDSATLTPAGESILDDAVATMEKHASIDVRIEGNTDSVGNDAYNMKLGQRRADAVQRYLVAHGISASRLTAVSYGETRPIASNDTAEGRAQNRRVDLVVE